MVSIYEVLGTQEVQTLRFLKGTAAELVGTCMLVVVGCGAAATVPADGSHDAFGVSSCFGLAVASAIWMFGHISGAHINPSISIGFLVTGHISVLKCLCYVTAQVLGGMAGAGLLWLVLPPGLRGGLGSNSLANGVADWQCVIVEMLGTFMLVMTVFASCDRLRADHNGSVALAIGFCITVQLTWMSNIDGGSLNPARSLGPAIFASKWENHWVFWVGPICGGILAALAYDKVFAEIKQTDKGVHHVKYNNCQAKPNGFLDYVIEIEPPADGKSENKQPQSRPQTNNIGNNNTDDAMNLQENVSKDQIFLKTLMSMDSKNFSSNIEDICVNYEEEDEQKEDNISEDMSNL